MRTTRVTGLLVAALLSAAVVSGCGDDSAGPLELRGDGMVVDPVDTGVWFRTSGCLAEGSDPTDVMVTGVTTSLVNDHVTTGVAWNDQSPVVLAKPGQPSDAYRQVTEKTRSGGTLDGCSLDVAVVLSSDAVPVVVRTVTVEYTADGKAYSTRTTLDATLCPAGTRASDAGDGCSESRRP